MNIFIYTYVNQSPFFISNFTSYNFIGNPNQHLKKKLKNTLLTILVTFHLKVFEIQICHILMVHTLKKKIFCAMAFNPGN